MIGFIVGLLSVVALLASMPYRTDGKSPNTDDVLCILRGFLRYDPFREA
jgi:hypothetical protein